MPGMHSMKSPIGKFFPFAEVEAALGPQTRVLKSRGYTAVRITNSVGGAS